MRVLSWVAGTVVVIALGVGASSLMRPQSGPSHALAKPVAAAAFNGVEANDPPPQRMIPRPTPDPSPTPPAAAAPAAPAAAAPSRPAPRPARAAISHRSPQQARFNQDRAANGLPLSPECANREQRGTDGDRALLRSEHPPTAEPDEEGAAAAGRLEPRPREASGWGPGRSRDHALGRRVVGFDAVEGGGRDGLASAWEGPDCGRINDDAPTPQRDDDDGSGDPGKDSHDRPQSLTAALWHPCGDRVKACKRNRWSA